MFPADMLVASYIEERSAAYEAKRLAAEKEAAKAKADSTRAPPPKPTGVLANLWQGFFKPAPFAASAASATSSAATSASNSAASTPTVEKTEQEARAERMREIDICAMRVY